MNNDDSKGCVIASLKDDKCEDGGLFCPICFEVSSAGGDHHVCCLPCGHIYGLSCIKKWLLRRRGSSKCPECKKECGEKDIRLLYAAQVVSTHDKELQKKVRSLEAKCASLDKQNTDWSKKVAECEMSKADLHKQVQFLQQVVQGKILSSEEDGKEAVEVEANRSAASMVMQMQQELEELRQTFERIRNLK